MEIHLWGCFVRKASVAGGAYESYVDFVEVDVDVELLDSCWIVTVEAETQVETVKKAAIMIDNNPRICIDDMLC